MPTFACICLARWGKRWRGRARRSVVFGPGSRSPFLPQLLSLTVGGQKISRSLRDIFSSFLEGWGWFQGLGDGRKAPVSSRSHDSATGKHGRYVLKARNGGELRTKSAKSGGWEAPAPGRGEETARPAQAEEGKFYPVPGGHFRISLSRGTGRCSHCRPETHRRCHDQHTVCQGLALVTP